MSKLLIFFLLILIPFQYDIAAQESNQTEPEYSLVDDHSAQHSDEAIEHEHHSDTNPLLFIILAVIIGGLTRFLLGKGPIPFTVALLVIGIGTGLLQRFDLLQSYTVLGMDIDISFFDKAVNWAAHIDPHMLLFVFLPILIFEAAFVMDVHIFKKVALNASILAIPGIIVAMLLTAGMIFFIYQSGWTLNEWNWELAMLFGAVVSATDPVAVVSILKELGASKKLGTLIEGESLLNDGTAIVIFMVILGGITGVAPDVSPVFVFLKVAFGGILVGAIVGWIIIKWIKKVFNDMLVEISAIIGAAYLTFIIAEHFLGVSGVLALVTFGIIMASTGRTKISPEVQHFLHKFWELAAFLANVLIFLIVGVVIAVRTICTVDDFLLLGLIYIGVFAVRAITITMFFPVMKNAGYGLKKKDSVVLWWGALRGAIGLALTLIVAGTESIPQDIRNQFLFLTAGIVTLTLLVNATTMKYLVKKLGLLKVSPAKQVMINNANEYLYQSSENALERLKKERFLKRSNWKEVKKYLPDSEIENVNYKTSLDFIQEARRRLLEKEKSSYWRQFKDGLLEPDAYRILVLEINNIIDSEGKNSLCDREDLEKILSVPKYFTSRKLPIFSKLFEKVFFDKMAISYDSARGFVDAQEDCLKLLQSMMRAAVNEHELDQLKIIQKEIEENQIIGLTYLRNIGKEFPEIYSSISTRKSIRTLLNYEKHTIERLNKNGRITDSEAEELIHQVEFRMKKLRDEKVLSGIPSGKDVLGDCPWLSGLDAKSIKALSGKMEIKSFAAEEVVYKKDDLVAGLYIIAYGTVEVNQNNCSVVLTGSSVLGEMKGHYKGEATALTPLTLLWISTRDLEQLFSKYEELKKTIWTEIGKNLARVYLGEREPFNRYSKSKLNKEIEKGKIVVLNNEQINLFNSDAILVDGELYGSAGNIAAPNLLTHAKYTAEESSIVFVL